MSEFERNIIISDQITPQLAGDIIKRIQDINIFDSQEEDEVEAKRSILAEQIKSRTTGSDEEVYSLVDLILPPYQREPIIITVNSIGGNAYDGFAIIGAMEMSETPIYTVCTGSAMSMALLLFVAGDVRFAHRMATFMYHDSSWGGGGTNTQMQRHIKEIERLNKVYDNYLLENTSLPQELLDDVRGKVDNLFFDAYQAQEYGVADVVLPDDNTVNIKVIAEQLLAEAEGSEKNEKNAL